MEETEQDVVLTPEEAGKLLGCSAYTVKEYARAGLLPCFKIGNRYRFRKSQLIAWIERQETENIGASKKSP